MISVLLCIAAVLAFVQPAAARPQTAGVHVMPASQASGQLASGAHVTVVMLESGGSGGAFAALVYAKADGAKRYVGKLTSPSGHLRVRIVAGYIEARTPIFAAGDANCCPRTARYDRYSVDARGLRKISTRVAPISR